MPTARKKTTKNQKPETVKILEDFTVKNGEKSDRVARMEDLVHNFDMQHILDLNEKLRFYYKKIGDKQILELLDTMTVIMQELTEIIHQVKTKRLSLEQGQKEIQEKLSEINEVLQTMKDWEATGI